MPSLPMTIHTLPLSSSVSVVCPSASAPKIQKPFSFSSSRAEGMLGTTARGTYSLAPEDTLATVWLSCAERRDGNDHQLRLELVRGAEDGAEILRIRDAVQDEDEGLLHRRCPSGGA